MARDRRPALTTPPPRRGPVGRLDDRDAERAARSGQVDAARLRGGTGRFRLPLGDGRPLSSFGPSIGRLAGHHGVDLSDVRIHHDAAAARLTEMHGARAVAVGRDIAFAPGTFRPGTNAGDELIEHELGHVVQQARAGVRVIQRDGPSGTGPGRRPPAEAFDRVTDGTLGEEDDHVLFEHDGIALPAAFAEQFQRLLAQHAGAVTVELHGYASDPGDANYNVNLSAHRAATVSRLVEPLLPIGSVVRLIAHGATSGFGDDARSNRRVGVDLSDRIPASVAFGLPRPSSALGIPELTVDVRLLQSPLLDPPPTTTTTTTPGTTGTTGTTAPTPTTEVRPHVVFTPAPPPWVNQQLFGPLAPPLIPPTPSVLPTLVWGDIYTDARGRGVYLGPADERIVAWHYTTYFPLAAAMYRHLPGVSLFFDSEADLANTFTRRAVNAALSGNPTPLEAFQAETDRMRLQLGLPTGFQTPSIGPTWRF